MDIIQLKEVYQNTKVRTSYKDDSGFEKMCTGIIVKENETHIIIHTIYDEEILIRKDLIGNMKKDIGGIANGKRKHNKS